MCVCCDQVFHTVLVISDDEVVIIGQITGVVAGVLYGFGMEGRGQVMFLKCSSVQNGRIFSYRYHCLSADNP